MGTVIRHCPHFTTVQHGRQAICFNEMYRRHQGKRILARAVKSTTNINLPKSDIKIPLVASHHGSGETAGIDMEYEIT